MRKHAYDSTHAEDEQADGLKNVEDQVTSFEPWMSSGSEPSSLDGR